MKLIELINELNEALKENGDIDVSLVINGLISDDITINCPDSESPLYIEGN